MKVIKAWFDPRLPAFALHRLSGLGLVAYLYLHLLILNTLRQGPQAWDGFVTIMRSPLVLGLDAVLLFGILFHGLNGLRLALVEWGLGLRWQQAAFWVCLAASLTLTVLGMLAMR